MSKYWVLCSTHISLYLNTSRLSKSCFYHIRALRHIRGSLDHLTIRTIAAALFSTRLDYANSILYGFPAKHISRLQCTQNTLAHVVTGKRYTDSSPSILKELHWLPIDACVKFKIATLTFKALNTGNPPYLASLLHRHTPCRILRSASTNLLSVTRCNLSFVSTDRFGADRFKRGIHHAADQEDRLSCGRCVQLLSNFQSAGLIQVAGVSRFPATFGLHYSGRG